MDITIHGIFIYLSCAKEVLIFSMRIDTHTANY
jgi:hypothetical protein